MKLILGFAGFPVLDRRVCTSVYRVMIDVEMEAVGESDEFHLSRVIEAHKADVKCITSTSAGVIISGGRDDVVKFWNKRGGEFSEALSFPQPRGLSVNSIGYYDSPDGWLVFAGRKDGSIAVYGSGSSEPRTVLTHHSSNVCCIYVDEKNHVLLSGSWDNNVVVWPIKNLLDPEFSALVLVGHTYSVWALAAIESNPGFYLTGSADKTIKLWRDDNVIRTFTGHNDVVRALLVISAEQFLSAGNDASIRMWHIESEACLASYPSLMETFIFSLAFVDSYVLAGSEGGHIEIWKRASDGAKLSLTHCQVIDSPAMTTWTVRGLPNGDFACGTSDGCIYIFTQKESQKASNTVLTTFQDAVTAKVIKVLERKEQQANEVVRIDVSLDDGIPNMQLLYKKGTDPAEAAEKFHQTAAARRQHRVQPTQRVTVDGKEYDYAFDVTVDDGRKLRLPYNLDEDTEVAAQRFVEKHNLPISFLAKVTSLLRSQTGGSSYISERSEFFDPLTGSSRYVPKQTSGSSSSVAIADPFTGTSRYVPGQSSNYVSVQGCGDPYTSSGSYKADPVTSSVVPNSCLPLDKKRPRGELVPVPCYYRFGTEQLSPKALAKLVEVNESQQFLKLSEQQITAIQRLMSGSEDVIDFEVVATALDIGLQWTITDLVPILDVFRVALLHEYLNTYFCDMKKRGENTHHRLSALLMSEPPDAISILVCRSMTNAFIHRCGREMLCHDFQNLFTAVTNQLTSNKVALQLAATSTLANWSLFLLNQSEKVSELGPREDAIRCIVKKCETIDSFGYLSTESMLRLLQAIVTFMWGDTTVIRLAKSRNLVNIVNKMKDAITDEQGKGIARDITEMIYSI
ncbi:hypothetical protein KIN20_011126 [Parelaphostrongylus tenuis]|uniref:Phospholipase A-2-activating protein n=1 Tax=Parelaphostrongylus tenuis TaxID=148309 RepID=A0AAD5QPM7_PARTN|nr:hypothetical protein KIN20_011126 [Parelaphostrongylus tenuis]